MKESLTTYVQLEGVLGVVEEQHETMDGLGGRGVEAGGRHGRVPRRQKRIRTVVGGAMVAEVVCVASELFDVRDGAGMRRGTAVGGRVVAAIAAAERRQQFGAETAATAVTHDTNKAHHRLNHISHGYLYAWTIHGKPIVRLVVGFRLVEYATVA